MKLSSTTLCLCSSLLIVAVHSAVTPKPADSKPAIDSDADPAKPAVTSSTSSTSSSSKSAAKSVTPKSAPAVKSEAPAKSEPAAKSATKAPAAAPSKATSSVSDDELDKLLQDRRYLSRQLKCALGEGVCDPVGRRLKSFAPLVLRGACPQCTPAETRQIQKVLSHVQRNYPKEWAKIIQQFTGNK
ncbi:hypothetical protein M8J75_011123 [Diaphorina citri]|nr:hypothetical protein M8J75_011123 [Diaphorina citri]